MRIFLKFLSILFLIYSCQTVTYSDNPILPDFQGDPSARIINNKIWIFPSHDITGSKHWDMVDWHASIQPVE